MSNELSEKQIKFLEVLFEQADGDLEKAAELAGYASPRHSSYWLVKTLRKEIADTAELYLARYGPAAAKALVETMKNPTDLANNVKVNAATQILDRIGVTKKEQLNVSSDQPIGVFILPAKEASNESDGT